MKRRFCVRSMGLGAGIMLIGLAVGAIVSPPLGAQRNGVFGDIECAALTVLDKNGKSAILLRSTEYSNNVTVEGKDGNSVYLSSSEDGSSVAISGKNGNGVVIQTLGEYNSVTLYSKEIINYDTAFPLTTSNSAITLSTGEANRLRVNDQTGDPALEVIAYPKRNELIFSGKPPYKAGIGFYGDTNEAKLTRWKAPKED